MFIDIAKQESFLSLLSTNLRVQIDKEQISAIIALAEQCDALSIPSDEQFSYILGTAYHESGFRPAREKRADSRRNPIIRKLQDKYWYSGYYGRGLVQLTWRKNYERFSKLLEVDLVKNPDLVLDVQLSAQIMVLGMRDGLFTGKALKDYFPPDQIAEDWMEARRIVNGAVKGQRYALHASEVAIKALHILRCIKVFKKIS